MSDPNPKKPKTTKKKRKPTNTKVVKRTNRKSLRTKKKLNPADGIAKSKQLVQKQQTSKANCRLKSATRNTNKCNTEVKVCGNGKPMPSLSELERMFEDSSSESETDDKHKNITDPTSSPTSPPTPIPTQLSDDKLKSPTVIASIANKFLDYVTNLTEPTLLTEDEPPPPVKKPKKVTKSGIPYIVGCEDRDYVPPKMDIMRNGFCKGDDKYGPDSSESEENDDVPKKRAKRTKRVNLSKSLFNAASDEIAARLTKYDALNSDTSTDSSKTVAYEYYTPNRNTSVRAFSPLPSTSRDHETFVKNDELFSESLIENTTSDPAQSNEPSIAAVDDEIEIIEVPCETIVINDVQPKINNNMRTTSTENTVFELLDDSPVGSPINNANIATRTVSKINDENIVEVVEIEPPSPNIVEDYYSNINVQTFNNNYDDDLDEVIDVDNIINENAAILNRQRRNNDLNTITSVNMTNSGISEALHVNNADSVITDSRPVTNNPSSSENLTRNHNNRSNAANTVNTVIDFNFTDDEETNDVAYQQIKQILAMMTKMPKAMEFLKDLHRKYPEGIRASCPTHREGSSPSSVPPDTGPKKLGDCPICMETLSNKPIASTICGHIFCMPCIKLSIISNGKKCPTCRKALRGIGFHQIFL